MNVRRLLPRDAIPSIDAPAFDATYFGDPDDEVVVVEPERGPARAYPLRVLHYHEVVNDVVGTGDVDPGGRGVEGTDGDGGIDEREDGGTDGAMAAGGARDRGTDGEGMAGSPATGRRGTRPPARARTGDGWPASRPGGSTRSPGRTTTGPTASTAFERAFSREPA